MFRRIHRDIQVAMERDPAARNALEVVLCYPGLHAIWCYRLAHWLWQRHLFLLARLLSNLARWTTLIEIHPAARIGAGCFIDHGAGVVIGETAELGRDVTLYQGVTLGGTGKEKGKRHPTVGNGVVIGTGARVLGNITIGDGTRIGASAVVLHDVPPDCTVVGNPARVVRRRGSRATVSTDGEGLGQPPGSPADLSRQLVALAARVQQLEAALAAGQAATGRAVLPKADELAAATAPGPRYVPWPRNRNPRRLTSC